jgi:hypothetical protein
LVNDSILEKHTVYVQGLSCGNGDIVSPKYWRLPVSVNGTKTQKTSSSIVLIAEDGLLFCPIKKYGMGRKCNRRAAHKLLVRKSEGVRLLARLRHRWDHNMKIDFKKTECVGMDWIHLAQDGILYQGLVKK